MERKNKILKTVSVVLLLCSFAVPMYNIFPNGLIVNQDSRYHTVYRFFCTDRQDCSLFGRYRHCPSFDRSSACCCFDK